MNPVIDALVHIYFQKLAMGVPPPLPAAARGIGKALGAARPMAGAARSATDTLGKNLASGVGGSFRSAPALNPWSKTGADLTPAARAKMHGDAADLAAVRKKIQAKYPDMTKSAQYDSFFSKTAGSLLARMGKAVSSETGAHATDLAGLGILAAPVADEVQAHGRAMAAGDHNKAGVEKRTVLPHGAGAAMELGGLGVLAAPSAAHLLRH